jgi:hypothetical protein
MKAQHFLQCFIAAFFLNISFGISAASTIQGPSAEMLIEGVPCLNNSLENTFEVHNCILAREHSVSGGVLPAGSHVGFMKGIVLECILSRKTAFFGQLLPAGSRLFFDLQGKMTQFWPGTDTVIQGYFLKARDDGAGDRLHPNGRLQAIWLVEDKEIDGIPCTSSGNIIKMGWGVISLGTKRMAWFYDNGRLQQALLSRDVTIQGRAFKKGEIISLTPDGKLDLTAKKLE